MRSIIVTEINALLMRNRLFDRLAGRTDIAAPETLAPNVARRIPSFMVAGLDNSLEPGSGGRPLPTGGRYPKLCFSPVLDRADEATSSGLYRLPEKRDSYVDYVEAITGIGRDEENDLARVLRFTPAELFDLCRDMRTACPPAWRLLLSNHFALAERLWPALREIPRSDFRHPLVDAFRIIAEIERANLIMRHLARARNKFKRPYVLEALASPNPLSLWFNTDELVELLRWLEYATLSSAALRDILFARGSAGINALPSRYPPLAFARGELPGGTALFLDDPEVRRVALEVFARPELARERRRGMLRNDEVLRWYGLTNEVLPTVALTDILTRFPARRIRRVPGAVRHPVVLDKARAVVANLSSAMRRRADPAMQRQVEAASIGYLKGSRATLGWASTLEANTKLGQRCAANYLPAHDWLGGAARFDPHAWKAPTRDSDFWRTIIDPGYRPDLIRGHPRTYTLRKIIVVMRRVYGNVFAGLLWSSEVERVVCDMAVALSPITVDPHIAYAIHALGEQPSISMGPTKTSRSRRSV